MYYEYYFYYVSIIKYVNNYEKYSVHFLFFSGLEKGGISMFNWEMSWAKAGGIWLIIIIIIVATDLAFLGNN